MGLVHLWCPVADKVDVSAVTALPLSSPIYEWDLNVTVHEKLIHDIHNLSIREVSSRQWNVYLRDVGALTYEGHA